MRIAMIGAGYVGLVSGACFADFGHEVICVDLDADKIAVLNAGKMPIFEPGLAELVAGNAAAGRLTFTTDLVSAVSSAEVVFLAVGTPARRGDGHADLTFVYAAAADVARAVKGFSVIVTESTVPVGTGDELQRVIRSVNPEADFEVVSNPEFLREGAAIEDFKRPDRIVIGMENERAQPVMAEVYRPLFLNQAPAMYTSRRSAELTKYGSNAFLAMKVRFINEMADLCEKSGGNVQDVARGMGPDNRIGSKFLNAGPGYGGSCFPKDTLALVKTGQDYESPMRLVEAMVAINEQRKRSMGRKVIAALGADVRGKRIGILGLTFKPNTDDMRDAPSISVIQALLDAGAEIKAYDPEGMEAARALVGGIGYAEDAYDAATGVDCLVLITEWNEFRSLDLRRLKTLMATPVLVDLRHVYRHAEVTAAGFTYVSIGRPAASGSGGEMELAQ